MSPTYGSGTWRTLLDSCEALHPSTAGVVAEASADEVDAAVNRFGPAVSRRTVLLALAAVGAVGASGVVVTRKSHAQASMDAYREENASWFARDLEHGANYDRCDNLHEAVQTANVIVLGSIVGARVTAPVRGETDDDVIYNGGYVVRVDRLISGRLTDPESDEIVVEMFMQDYDRSKDIDRAAADAPKGTALWILRSNRDIVDKQIESLKKAGRLTERFAQDAEAAAPFYQPVGIWQGVLMQGESHVVAPFDDDKTTHLAAEAATYAKLSDLLKVVESLI